MYEQICLFELFVKLFIDFNQLCRPYSSVLFAISDHWEVMPCLISFSEIATRGQYLVF